MLTICTASAGTGKTYTLTARYIALLMDSAGDREYRHILAVTFTNKATAEMKQRILFQLHEIAANSQPGKFIASVRKYMKCSITDDEMAAKANQLYHNILDDYDNMKVSTIDSFLQQLISGMAMMMNIGADFSVELDSDHVIAQAVDEIMTSHIKDNPDTVDVLERYLNDRMDDEKGWDVRKNIVKMSKELLKEAVLSNEKKIESDAGKIASYKKQLNWMDKPAVKEMRMLYGRVKDCEGNNEIESGSNYYKFIERMRQSLENKAKKDKRWKALNGKYLADLPGKKFNCSAERRAEIMNALNRMHELCPECEQAYLVSEITSKYLNDMSMMSFVRARIKQNLDEANTILLARTAYVLASALKPGDADFILEKAGIRYRHIMIDEFQDTSVMQWEVFRQLFNEVLASGGTALIVGDMKQSIYRWRNGDYRIMQDLVKRNPDSVSPLRTNFRSQARIVDFNYHFFEFLLSDYAKDYSDLYKEKGKREEFRLDKFCDKAAADAGFVRVRAYPYLKSGNKNDAEQYLTRPNVKQQIINDLFSDIKVLTEAGASPDEMLILVRRKKEAQNIVDMYGSSSLEAEGIRLCSNDSFVLESSRSVQTVVSVLKAIGRGDKVAEAYVKMGVRKQEEKGEEKAECLTELVERVIRELLIDSEGNLIYNDAAYLNYLVDEVESYVSKYGSNVKGFLKYWDDKLHEKAISTSADNGVRIMTIHSAKGLENKYVFIPFCDWDMEADKNDTKLWCEAPKVKGINMVGPIPAAQMSDMRKTKEYAAAYDAEHEAQKVDNMNLLYVAMTRACDHLYINIDAKNDMNPDNPANVGDLLLGYLKDEKAANADGTVMETFRLKSKDYKLGDADVYAEFAVGNPAIQEAKDDEDGEKAKERHYRYCSDSSVVRFRQSQESFLFMRRGAEQTEEMMRRIAAGNLRHDIYAQIMTTADAPKVIERFYSKGLIETRAEADAIAAELEHAWHNEKMADWFSGRWQVMREMGIIDKNGELRPDRVMILDNKAVVLDFKFGKQNHARYSEQVEKYMERLRKMGYEEVEGYLWYGFDNELIPIENRTSK